MCSFNRVELFDGHHESAHANAVSSTGRGCGSTALSLHKLSRAVVHSVELSNLVAETDALEEDSDLISSSRELEIVLSDAELGKGGGEQKVNRLGLITVVL